MNIAILSIGNEILSGDTINTNATWMGNRLVKIGCSIQLQMTVRDCLEDINFALNQLVDGNPNYIIITGGLGPTDDDITRKVLFDFVGTKSIFDNEYWITLSNRFMKFGKNIPELNKNQAIIPENGDIIQNPLGSARGYRFIINNSVLIALPGVPIEMKKMMENSVIPEIKKSIINPVLVRTLRTTGIAESILLEKIKQPISRDYACNIGYYPSLYGVDIKISSKDLNQINSLADELYKIIGTDIYSEGEVDIEEVVVNNLKRKKNSIAIAESCTGGLIGDRVTNTSGSSLIFKGGIIVYSNEAKIKILGVDENIINTFGAVSKQTAREMAEKIKKLYLVNFGLSVTGIAGPDGGTSEKPVGLVYVGLANDKTTKVKKFNFGSNRITNKISTSQSALNYLRLELKNE